MKRDSWKKRKRLLIYYRKYDIWWKAILIGYPPAILNYPKMESIPSTVAATTMMAMEEEAIIVQNDVDDDVDIDDDEQQELIVQDDDDDDDDDADADAYDSMFCDALPSRSRSFTLSELFSMASSSRSELPDLNLSSSARLPFLGLYQNKSLSLDLLLLLSSVAITK